MKISPSDSNEYPPWDRNGFERYLKGRNYDRSKDDDEENELHLQKLKYYYGQDF